MSTNISNEIDHAEVISAEREATGKKLIWFAWAVEILAVTIGLAIALMQGLTSFSELSANTEGNLGFAHYTNIVIAMLPFIMVAAVEATKIPFVEAAYKTTKNRWKVVFSAGLIFLAFITFESALNGFERNFQALIFSIDKFKKELVAVEEEMEPIEEQRDKLANLTASKIETDYSNRHTIISSERDTQTRAIQDRIQSLRAANQTEYIKSLRSQVDEQKSQLKTLRKERQTEIDAILSESKAMTENSMTELNTQRRSMQQQLQQEQEYLEELRKNSEKEIEDAGFFSESSTRKRNEDLLAKQSGKVEKLRQQLNKLSDSNRQESLRDQYQASQESVKARYQKQMNVINAEIKSLSFQLSKSLGSRDKDIEQAVKGHMKELMRIEKQFSKQQGENERIRDDEFSKLSRNEELINGIDANLLSKKQRRVVLRNEINKKVGDNQVYRMAQWWYGKESAADLNRRDVMFIASMWFGSLAILIAITGILLALASYVIRDPRIPNEKTEDQRVSSLLRAINSFRRYLIYRRRLQRQPKIREVIKEIPVDRVVMVDKPIEIIKKEIVHVPLYTEDRSLISTEKTRDKTDRDDEQQDEPKTGDPKTDDSSP
jgi:hypothetical protein